VQARDLAGVADELYTLAPAGFRAARDERAAQARAAGDADLAAAIRKLRRPTVSAWLVNLLVREDPGQVDELLELGGSLREAQQALAGDRLRELSGQRRRLITALTQEARRLAEQAGQPLSAQAEREVQETLEAALADPGIAEAVRSGWLTSALSYAGLGTDIDVSGAVAVWPTPAERPARKSREAGTGGGARQDAAAGHDRQEAQADGRARRAAGAAERNRREAADDAREAQAGLDEAEREVAGARDEHEALLQRAEELERQLGLLQAESAQRLRALRQAQRRRDVAARALDGAVRRLARAEAKASQHR